MRKIFVIVMLFIVTTSCSLFRTNYSISEEDWNRKIDKFWEYYSLIKDSLNQTKTDCILLVYGCGGNCIVGSTPILYVFSQNSNRSVRRIDILGEYSIEQRPDSVSFNGVLNYTKCIKKDTLWIEPESTLFKYYNIKIRINSKSYYYWTEDDIMYIDDTKRIETEDTQLKCLKNLILYIRNLLPKEEFEEQVEIEKRNIIKK